MFKRTMQKKLPKEFQPGKEYGRLEALVREEGNLAYELVFGKSYRQNVVDDRAPSSKKTDKT